MSIATSGSVVRCLEALFQHGTRAGLREGDLLERFHTSRDESAFAVLVGRYGPMVRGVCHSLRLAPDAADDAFQATFLVLARRAGDIRDPDRLGPWLYGVAYRVAAKMRSSAARRHLRESPTCPKTLSDHADPRTAHNESFDQLHLIHEELARLPVHYRETVILCLLDGRTCSEAADRMRCPVGTVKGRLSRAKELLKDRLTRRGIGLTTAGIALSLSNSTRGEISKTTLETLSGSAVAYARGGPVATALAASAQQAEKVVTAMTLTTWKWVATGLLAVGVATAGSGDDKAAKPVALAGFAFAQDPAGDASARKAPDQGNLDADGPRDVARTRLGPDEPDPAPARRDLEPLPNERLEAARQYFEAAKSLYKQGTIPFDRFLAASARLRKAERDEARTDAERQAAQQRHTELARQIFDRERAGYEVGSRRFVDLAEANLNLIESRLGLEPQAAEPAEPVVAVAARDGQEIAQEKGAVTVDEPAQAAAPAEEALDTFDADKLTDRVRTKLEQPISLPFDSETPLSDVVMYLKSATTSKDLPGGIPVYIDPLGLKEAELTVESPVTIHLEGISLKRGLYLALRSIGLAYTIQDGLLIISTPDKLQEILAADPIVEPKAEGGFQ